MVKNPPANAGDVNLIPGLGRPPSRRKWQPLWYSCLDIPMDRGSCHKELDMTEQSTEHTCRHIVKKFVIIQGSYSKQDIILNVSNALVHLMFTTTVPSSYNYYIHLINKETDKTAKKW